MAKSREPGRVSRGWRGSLCDRFCPATVSRSAIASAAIGIVPFKPNRRRDARFRPKSRCSGWPRLTPRMRRKEGPPVGQSCDRSWPSCRRDGQAPSLLPRFVRAAVWIRQVRGPLLVLGAMRGPAGGGVVRARRARSPAGCRRPAARRGRTSARTSARCGPHARRTRRRALRSRCGLSCSASGR